MAERRVAVTGMGLVSPLGSTLDALYANLLAGVSGIRRMRADFSERLECKIAAQVDFDPLQYFSKSKAGSLDRVSQFALAAAGQAIDDAGLKLEAVDKSRIGIYLGTAMGGQTTNEEACERVYGPQGGRLRPLSVVMAMMNAAAAQIGLEFDLRAANLTFSTACASSAVAIGEAFHLIRRGGADVMLAGGSEALLTLATIKAWEALRALATEDAGDPAASCKPFAADRSGLVLGEGAALLVLEDREHALARGARIYAELAGYGSNNDCRHITQPSVEGQAAAMRAALSSAGLAPGDIGYINAHGTATPLNDATETAAIRQVFGAAADRVPVSSSKSMHGHLMGATAAIELIISILALTRGVLPPTINLHHPDPACDLDYVPNIARSGVALHYVMSNSFAFGGTSGVLIAGKV